MRLISIIIIAFTATVTMSAQKLLFKSNSYEIYSDKVVQGKYSADAKSSRELVSSYMSNYHEELTNLIIFKFSINGLDNENEAGINHELLLNPTEGKVTSPVYVFGEKDKGEINKGDVTELAVNTEVTFRLDMRKVLRDLKTKGYFRTYDGAKITAEEFKGVYIAGSTYPLDWDFPGLKNKPEFKLTDPDGDGIYEVTIKFDKTVYPGRRSSEYRTWKLKKDISAYPSYHSPDVLIDALYNMSLEEMMLDIRPDGAFMAGAKWPGIWTRDISYSILLSLAIANPDAAKASLMAKVKNRRIIQDTGTGGAWPVSTDRLIWAAAAWEVYLATGDKGWLKSSYEIIKNSAEDDMKTVYDKNTGMFRGESSFLDWREQTYPKWMDPKDIFSSKNLGTNAVHYEAFMVLAKMASILKKSPQKYIETAEKIERGMNKYLWQSERGYYGQYLYGRNYYYLSPRSEALGEALSVLFGAAPEKYSRDIIEKTPVTEFGITCIYPQIPGIPPYHNNAVWPFVEAYWTWASAKTGNAYSVERGLASIYRAAAMFLTNKENMDAGNGDYLGTQINSDRQLWSVAGNIGMIYRVIFGISLSPEGMSFSPFIPEAYSGKRTLSNLKYRNSVLAVSIDGFGSEISEIKMDGRKLKRPFIPADINGHHKIEIKMNNAMPVSGGVNLQEDDFAPPTPVVETEGGILKWRKITDASKYYIYKNGEKTGETMDTLFACGRADKLSDYQVAAVDEAGLHSFLSEPVSLSSPDNTIVIQAEAQNEATHNKYKNYSGSGYAVLDTKSSHDIKFKVTIKDAGTYAVDFRYANGEGPINTDNKCAVRTLLTDGANPESVVFPQRGADNWNNWGYTNSNIIKLSKGAHKFTLTFRPSDNNMNLKINYALLDCMRIRRLK